MSLDFDLVVDRSDHPRRKVVNAIIKAARDVGIDDDAVWDLDDWLTERMDAPPRRDVVFDRNITHNLTPMASAAGVYQALWRPEEQGWRVAADIIEPLRAGLALLRSDPERFRAYNSPNGWGLYRHFVPFVEACLTACEEHPDAEIEVSR